MKNKTIFIFIAILLILQVSAFFYFSKNITIVNENIFKARQDITETNNNLELSKKELQSNINEISKSLIETKKSLTETQSSLEKEISSLKAQTSADFSGIIDDAIRSVISIRTNTAQGTGFNNNK